MEEASLIASIIFLLRGERIILKRCFEIFSKRSLHAMFGSNGQRNLGFNWKNFFIESLRLAKCTLLPCRKRHVMLYSSHHWACSTAG